MEKEFDLLVFIGRFSPFHVEHKRIVDIALQKSRNVLILVGSAGKARTIRNPFTFDERAAMIMGAYDAVRADGQGELIVKPLYDKTYNDAAWIKQVQDIVKDTVLEIGSPFDLRPKIGLIGASKDVHTEFYLRMFPQWQSVDAGIETNLHATTIREAFLDDHVDFEYYEELVPASVTDFFFGSEEDNARGVGNGFINTEAYMQLRSELNFVRNYKKQWEVSPYPVKHATVDAVVEQSGHILLVKRRSEPGKGLWALPGGHLDEYECQIDGAIRELREETGIKVPEAVLRGSIRDHATFDDPYRSTLGRVITKAYHFKLADSVDLPKIKIPKGVHGVMEVEKAKWVPISDLREEDLFDDHYFLISYFLSL